MPPQPRVRGLQDLIKKEKGGCQSSLQMLNKLAQLQREKERISQERQNWQTKIDLINTRLAEIAEAEKTLLRFFAGEDATHAGRLDREAGQSEVCVDPESANDASAHTVTIRY